MVMRSQLSQELPCERIHIDAAIAEIADQDSWLGLVIAFFEFMIIPLAFASLTALIILITIHMREEGRWCPDNAPGSVEGTPGCESFYPGPIGIKDIHKS